MVERVLTENERYPPEADLYISQEDLDFAFDPKNNLDQSKRKSEIIYKTILRRSYLENPEEYMSAKKRYKETEKERKEEEERKASLEIRKKNIKLHGADFYADKSDPNLPVFNLRHINVSGDSKFWEDIGKRYPSIGSDDNVLELGHQILTKLMSYKNFIHIIVDIDGKYSSNTIADQKQLFNHFREKSVRDSLPGHLDTQLISMLKFFSPEELNIHLVNFSTGEGLEPGKLDNYLSVYGNAIVASQQHATVIRKKSDGNYIFINSQGKNSIDRELTTYNVLKKAIPPGSILEETGCILQTTRGVCFLYAILFMSYPDLPIKSYSGDSLTKIINTTFQRVNKSWVPNIFVKYDLPSDRNDLYILALMEDFLFTDQTPFIRETSKQRLERRRTAGKRKQKRNKKTRRLLKRKLIKEKEK
jgi:hypothetical protein